MPRFLIILFFWCFFFLEAFANNEAQLFKAVQSNDLKSLELILSEFHQQRKITNHLGQTLLYSAAEQGKKEIVSKLLDLGFDSNEPNQPPSHLSPRSQFSASNPGMIGKKRLTPRKRSQSAFLSPGLLPTPLFALLKIDAQTKDLEIAKILLNQGADPLIKDGKNNTPISILVDFLYALSQEDFPIELRNRDVLKTRNLFLKAVEHQELLPNLLKYWHFFSTSYATAQILYEYPEYKQHLKPLRKKLINWQLDNKLPSPESALDIYQKSQILLSKKNKFLMLYNYIVLYNHNKIMNSENHSPIYLDNTIFEYSYKQVAELLFLIDKQHFLLLSADEIMMRFCHKKKEGKVETFLARTELLKKFITQSIVMSKNPKKSALFWQRVGKKLLDLGDLFGLQGVYSGINSQSVNRILSEEYIANLLKELPEIGHYQTYAKIKNERNGHIILSLPIDSGRLTNIIENTDLSKLLSNEEESLENNYTIFAQEIELAQQFLKQESHKFHYEIDKNLYKILTDLYSAGGDKLFSLHQKYQSQTLQLPEKPIEDWSMLEFYSWLKQYALISTTGLTIHRLIELGITHPRRLVECYISFLANNKIDNDDDITNLMNIFDNYCDLMKRPFLTLPDAPFKDEVINFAQTPFNWIMWLKNNELYEDIPSLFASGIDTFATFSNRMKRKEKLFYTQFTVDKLKNLYQKYELSRNLPDALSKWDSYHLEAWLLSKGLHHLFPSIIKDCKNGIHRFFAYGYFLHVHPVNSHLLPNTNNWIFRVFEELKKEYYLEETIINFNTAERTKKKNINYLYFIYVLRELGLENLLPVFYKNKIFSFYRLKNIFHNNELLSELGIDKNKKELLEKYIIDTKRSYSLQVPFSQQKSYDTNEIHFKEF